MVNELSALANQLSETQKHIQLELEANRRIRKVQIRLFAFGTIVIVVALILLTIISIDARNRSIEGRQRSQQTARIVQETKATADIIRGCIDPTGECKRQGDKATADAIGQLVQAQLKIADCQVMANGNLNAFRECTKTLR